MSATATVGGGKAKRAVAIAALRGKIRGASGMVFVNAQRLDSAETFELRKSLRPAAVSLQVVKNRLMKIACVEEKIDGCGDWLKDNTAVAFLEADPAAAVKTLATFAGEHEKLVLKGALIDGRPVGLNDLKALAALPGRPQLLAQAAGAMKALMSRGARSFAAVYVKMALLMKEAAKKAPRES